MENSRDANSVVQWKIEDDERPNCEQTKTRQEVFPQFAHTWVLSKPLTLATDLAGHFSGSIGPQLLHAEEVHDLAQVRFGVLIQKQSCHYG